eukprot:7023001-Prymnesium_polylepis.1
MPPHSGLNVPRGHVPEIGVVLPSSQKCPAPHGPVHWRFVSPAVAPYLPAAHGCGPVAPSAHAKPFGQT